MKSLLITGTFIADLFRSRTALQIEILALRHQLAVLQRNQPRRLQIHPLDRLLWILLSRIWQGWREALVIVKPATVIHWHREGFRLFWKWKSSRKRPGRPAVTKEINDLIRKMSLENPLWGAPRIHGELLKLGYQVAETSVAKYMIKPAKPPSQTWKTFLENHANCLVAMDLFTVPTVFFKVFHVLILLDHDRRRIIHFNITTNPTAAWVAQQIRDAFPWDSAPRYLIHDRDPIFQGKCQDTLKAMGIKDVKTAPTSPWQNAYCERVIVSIRRECLDHIIVVNEEHLRRTLTSYLTYYHGTRTHLGLAKDCPESRTVQPMETGDVIAIPHLGGLHHQYVRKAA
ncbi:MAG: transposase [Magnetococcales bacterium]|nr:transposase [Magnetococcales bacterium]